LLRMRKPSGEYYFPEHAAIPIVACVAVDGKNFNGRWLNGVALTVFWTQFALDEAKAGGHAGKAIVIPLGVHLDVYHPMDKAECRRRRLLPGMQDKFIVGNINRNQPRKRWDLCVKYFAEWVKTYNVDNALLYLQAAPTGEMVMDVRGLAAYYGVTGRVAIAESDACYGVSEQDLAETYNCFDLCISTTQGEGFGLTALEAMACGVPCVLPAWSALGDWAQGAAWLVPCTSTVVGSPFVNVIGGVADEVQFTRALQRLYVDVDARGRNAQAALEAVQQPRFRWENIGQQYLDAIDGVLYPEIVAQAPEGVSISG